MQSANQNTFLSLVRMGIGHSSAQPDVDNWQAIKALADKQGLTAVVADGIEKLQDTKRPPKELLLQWIGEVLQGEATFKLHKEVASDMANLFHCNQIRTYVLKGLIVAECYPRHNHRVSVDMDCYLQSEKEKFDAAKKYNIPYTIHAGEAAGAISVQEALDLGAYRIGHGIRSIEDEKVLDRIIQEGIPLECCPTSNKITKAIENMNDYPLKELLSRGVKVTVNTDDMAICRTKLSKEFEYIRETFKITAEEEKQLYLNAVEAAFCSKKTRDELRSLFS